MQCCSELQLFYVTVALLLRAEVLGGAMESKRSSILVAQNADDLKSLDSCTTRNQQRLGSVFGNFTRHHKKGHRRRTTTTTQSTITSASDTTEAITEIISETPFPKPPEALRLTDEDVNIDDKLVRRHKHKENVEELEESSLATSMSRTKKMYRDSTGSNVNKISSKGRGGIFLTDNCTTVIAQIGTTAVLHCEVSDITENTVTWIRKKDYSLLSVGLVTYSADSRFFSAHGRHVKSGSHETGNDCAEDRGDRGEINWTLTLRIGPHWLTIDRRGEMEGRPLPCSGMLQDWALHIRFATSADGGYYECQVPTHPPTSIFFKLVLVAAYAEIVGESEKIIHEGSMLRLVCVVKRSTEPPSYVFWYFENRMINYDLNGVSVHNGRQTSELVIGKAEPRHAGNYTCVPANAKAASVTVHVVQSETPAAMQHGNNSPAPKQHTHNLIHFLITLIALRTLLIQTHQEFG